MLWHFGETINPEAPKFLLLLPSQLEYYGMPCHSHLFDNGELVNLPRLQSSLFGTLKPLLKPFTIHLSFGQGVSLPSGSQMLLPTALPGELPPP